MSITIELWKLLDARTSSDNSLRMIVVRTLDRRLVPVVTIAAIAATTGVIAAEAIASKCMQM